MLSWGSESITGGVPSNSSCQSELKASVNLTIVDAVSIGGGEHKGCVQNNQVPEQPGDR